MTGRWAHSCARRILKENLQRELAAIREFGDRGKSCVVNPFRTLVPGCRGLGSTAAREACAEVSSYLGHLGLGQFEARDIRDLRRRFGLPTPCAVLRRSPHWQWALPHAIQFRFSIVLLRLYAWVVLGRGFTLQRFTGGVTAASGSSGGRRCRRRRYWDDRSGLEEVLGKR
jgi:hypothetical protein